MKLLSFSLQVGITIGGLAVPVMKPKALIAAVKKKHSDAPENDIARAAFFSVIHSAEFDPGYTQALHDIAMETRDDDHD